MRTEGRQIVLCRVISLGDVAIPTKKPFAGDTAHLSLTPS